MIIHQYTCTHTSVLVSLIKMSLKSNCAPSSGPGVFDMVGTLMLCLNLLSCKGNILCASKGNYCQVQ